MKEVKAVVTSIDILPFTLARLEGYIDNTRIIVGNSAVQGPIAAVITVTGTKISSNRQIARPLTYGPNLMITTERLTTMLVHRLGTLRQHILLGFENGALVILCAETMSLVAAARLECSLPPQIIAYDEMNGTLVVVTTVGTIYRLDRVTSALSNELIPLLTFQRYDLPNVGGEICTCGFVSSQEGESRFLVLYSCGRIDLFKTSMATFLQPETNHPVTLPLLNTEVIITAFRLCLQTETLFVGTFEGAVHAISLKTLAHSILIPNCGGPVSAIAPIEDGVCAGTLSGRIFFKDSIIYDNPLCSIRCLEPLNPRLPEVLAGTDRWTLLLTTL